MKLDGYDVEIGDSVFDVARGPGVVESITGNEFVVAFRDFSTTYKPTGHGGFAWRTLYWRNPIPVPPSKSDKVHETATRIYHVLYQELKRLQ